MRNIKEFTANTLYINKLIKKLNLTYDLKYKNINFLSAFKRSMYVELDKDAKVYDLLKKIKKKNINEPIFVKSYYFYTILNILYSRKKFLVHIKLNFLRKHLTELNLLTKFLAKLYICWKFNFQIESKRKTGTDQLYYNSDNYFNDKIFNLYLDNFFKKSKVLIKSTNNKGFFFNFIKNLNICFKNKYKTNNFMFLVLHIKFDIIENALKNKGIVKGFFLEGDAPDHELISHCIKKYGGKTYCFQQGTYTGNVIPSFFRDFSYDYFFSWGNFYKDKIKKFNLNTKIISIGRAGRNNKKTNKKNIILFAAQDTNIAGTSDTNNSKKYFYDYCEWCLKEFKDYKIFLKPHPKYPPSDRARKLLKYKNFVICKNTEDINKFLPFAKILVSISSTTLIDALNYNVIPINFMPFYPFEPNLEKNKIGLVTKNFDESKNKIKKIINNKDYYTKFVKKNKEYFIKNNFDICFKELIKKKII